MKEKASVVPWRNVEEFQKVYEGLYSSSITDKRWACDQIDVWQTRCHPGLPTAIEVTVDLVNATIEDLLFEVSKSLSRARSIRAQYAYGVMRFVSLVLETDQNGLNKTPLTVLAEKRGIPDWMVEMRHDICHSFSPSLSVLRMGSKWALQYLEKDFWKIEAANIRPVVRAPSDKKEIILDLINQYKIIQHQRVDDLALRSSLANDCRAVLKKISKHVEESKKLVIEVLVQPGVFTCSEDLIKILKASIPVYLETEDDLSLPTDLEKLWLPIIKILHLYNAIPMFLEKLILSQEKCSIPILQKIAAAWALRIFLATSSLNTKSALDRCFKKKGVLFNFYVLLYACMKGGNKYLIHVFDAVASRLGNRERFSDLYCIMGLYQGFFLEKKGKDSQQSSTSASSKRPRNVMEEIHFTIEDAEEDINELKSKRKRSEDKNPWSLAPASINWSEIPLGAVINPVLKPDASQESQPEATSSEKKEERFILINENDNEEITVVKKGTSDSRLKTFIPDGFDMVYRGKQKN